MQGMGMSPHTATSEAEGGRGMPGGVGTGGWTTTPALTLLCLLCPPDPRPAAAAQTILLDASEIKRSKN